MTELTGKPVVLTDEAPSGIASGLTGRCVWDEGGPEVVVEFDRDVPNGGYLISSRQAWVPRTLLRT